MKETNGKRITAYFDERTMNLIESNINLTSARSRSEFLSFAVETYATVLNKDNTTRVLTPALESVIGATVGLTEKRISRVMFKQSVELAMLMHLIAATYEFDRDTLEALRRTCIGEVCRLNGNLKFDDAADYELNN